ncbi:MAG: CPBP family intramembrane metalloprotease [Cyclobacteriaceae bacterium]
MEIANLSIGVALVVGLIFPVIAILEGKKTHQLLLTQPDKKPYVFRLTAIQLIVLSIVSLLPILFGHFSLNDVGLGFVWQPFYIFLLFGICLLVWWLLGKLSLNSESAEKFLSQSERIKFLLPTNQREYKIMAVVSFIAGVCEEIVYRGFLFFFLNSYLPLLPALLLANLPFALAHLTTTGLKNTIQAFVLGLIFSGAYLLTGSLWLSILLHILVDLYSTTLSYKANKSLKNVSINN